MGQVFVISGQRSSTVFVPVAVFLLPDKMRISYAEAFSLFREALEVREVRLSAEYFMSDFEPAIKQDFTNQFPLIKPKGCSFHFSKAIITKVQKSGFKSDYVKRENVAFGSFIRAILGLVYCPLERFKEAIRNLYLLAKRLTVIRQRKFSLSLHDQLRSPLLCEQMSSSRGVEPYLRISTTVRAPTTDQKVTITG